MAEQQTHIESQDSGRREFDLKGFLEFASQDPFLSSNDEFPVIYPKVQKGDSILKIGHRHTSESRRYLSIDTDEGALSLTDVEMNVRNSKEKIRDLFTQKTTSAPYQKTGMSYYEQKASASNGKYHVPLSELLKDKRGECVEMATMAQLYFQNLGIKSYLVSGYLHQSMKDQAHTWNIVERNNEFFIFDPKNDFESKISSVVFENGIYSFVTEEKVNFFYRLGR